MRAAAHSDSRRDCRIYVDARSERFACTEPDGVLPDHDDLGMVRFRLHLLGNAAAGKIISSDRGEKLAGSGGILSRRGDCSRFLDRSARYSPARGVGSTFEWDGASRAVAGAEWTDGIGTVVGAFDHRRNLRGDDLSRVLAEAVRGVDAQRRGGSADIGDFIRGGARLSGLESDDCDWSVWVALRDFGGDAEEFAAGNDGACVARWDYGAGAGVFGEARKVGAGACQGKVNSRTLEEHKGCGTRH